jgi:alkylation response protein AidB-like acyl-CoA dehydrogenase
MDFRFSEDQRLFQSTVRDLLTKECTPAHVRAAWESDDGLVPGLWQKLAGLGVIGLLASEAYGGLGLDETDLVLILEEIGRAAMPGPVLETAAVVVPVLREIGDTEWTPNLVSGNTIGTFAFARREEYVVGARQSQLMLWMGRETVNVMPIRELGVVDQPALDRGRRLSSVEPGPLANAPDIRFDRAFAVDRAVLGSAAQLLGVADAMITMTSAYAREREQFGKPIGSFQAVKHHLANALLKLEFARPAVYRAAHSLATNDHFASRDVSMGKVMAADAALLAARVALQVHGAIGYTWEHDLQVWMKSAWALAAHYGDGPYHRAMVARALDMATD